MPAKSGLQLLLLPGLDGTGKLFKPFVDALPLSIDPHIVSYPANECLSLKQHADLVARYLSDRTVILAESFSGLVALTLLAQQKFDVSAVIFCGAFAESPRPLLLRLAPLVRYSGGLVRSIPAFLLRRFCLDSEATSEQLAWLRDVLAEMPAKTLVHRLGLIAARHPFSNLKFKVPCCYLQAEGDRLVPSSAATWFSRHFEPFYLEKVKGPHFMLQAQPTNCAERVSRLLSRLT